MATFGLVHGAWLGAWCWERLVPELEVRMHEAVAVELPADDPNAGLESYAEAIVAALRGHEDVVVVGHSLAGHVVPLVPSRRPVRHPRSRRARHLAGLVAPRRPGRGSASTRWSSPAGTRRSWRGRGSSPTCSSAWPEGCCRHLGRRRLGRSFPRGARMPVIDVKLYEHRVTEESVPRMIEALTHALANSSGAAPEHIHVIIQGIPPQHWGQGGKPGA